MADPIPAVLAELTPEWLTKQLHESGVLKRARITKVEPEILGEGEGFVGQIARIALSLDREEATAPDTLIAKLPTTVAANRKTGELFGMYEREILFYRDLAQHVALRTPRLYGSDMDENPAAEQGPAIVAFVDRLPFWLMRVIMAVIGWIVGQSTRRYVLLLEDLAPARLGDQVAGCDPETCRRVLVALASAQASLWESPHLLGRHWVGRQDLGANITQQMFRQYRPAFEKRFAHILSEWSHGTLDWLDAHGADLLRALHSEAPQTFIHGDLRLDNLFFDATGEPIAVDWQGVSRGPGVFDVAYFLSGSLDLEISLEEERVLVATYHRELVRHGVSGYDADRCVRDYERSLLTMLHRMVTIDTIDLGEERGAELIDVWIARVLRRVQDVDLDALLSTPALSAMPTRG